MAMIALVSGCAAPEAPRSVYQIDVPFDEARTKELNADGDANVRGTAFMRQRGGGVVTCAGSAVSLLPATSYAAERMRFIYGMPPAIGEIKTIEAWTVNGDAIFDPDPPGYSQHMRKTVCDAQGAFEFEKVKDGTYFVVTSVVWQVSTVQGGFIATQVQVRDGKAARVIISK